MEKQEEEEAFGGGGGKGKRGRERKRTRRRRVGWVAFGQFVIKLKIPSAEEADERVTNGRDRNGSSTGRRHVTTDKRRTRVYPVCRFSVLPCNVLPNVPLSLSLSRPIFFLHSSLRPRSPSLAGFPWGAVGTDGGGRVKSSCEQFSIAETPLETRARELKSV